MTIITFEYNRHAGLGNKLFPWARTIISAERYNVKYYIPPWVSIRGAAVTRGGIDYRKVVRKIFLFDNFKNDVGAIHLIKFYFYKLKLREVLINDLSDVERYLGENVILKFRWNSEHNFSDLQGYELFLKNKLISITRDKLLQKVVRFQSETFIGLNVRSGNDFIKSGSKNVGYEKTSLEWFQNALKKILVDYGKNSKVIIVSDGGKNDLALLLKNDNIHLFNSTSAIEDLLLLLNSKVLLASGNSTFCAWASFLGMMDTYSAPQTPFEKFSINIYNSKDQKITTL